MVATAARDYKSTQDLRAEALREHAEKHFDKIADIKGDLKDAKTVIISFKDVPDCYYVTRQGVFQLAWSHSEDGETDELEKYLLRIGDRVIEWCQHPRFTQDVIWAAVHAGYVDNIETMILEEAPVFGSARCEDFVRRSIAEIISTKLKEVVQ